MLSERLTIWYSANISTTDANYTLYLLVNGIKNNRLYCAFIDREILYLYDCLTQSGISSKMWKILITLYSNTCFCEKLNDVSFDMFLHNRGLRQDDSLSPVLFILATLLYN